MALARAVVPILRLRVCNTRRFESLFGYVGIQDAENYRLEVEQTVERMQCASARSDALPPLRRLPVKLPVPLGASRTLITADDVFLTRVSTHV